jgi:hypothetical protein
MSNKIDPDSNKMTPLMVAASKGDMQLINELIFSGVDVNETDIRGGTALMYAAMNKFLYVVNALLDAGADPTVKTHKGFSALDFANQSAAFVVISRIEKALVQYALISKKVEEVLPPIDYTTASPNELKKRFDRIAIEMGDNRFFTWKELAHLPRILSNWEQILAFTSGYMDGNTWLIALTDKRVILLDTGMFVGLKQQSIDLDKVTSVSAETGFLHGKIVIEASSSKQVIDHVKKATVIPFTNKVRDAISARKVTASDNSKAPPSDDLISKLERLGSLLERGIISQSEFAEQKARLLA